jgi:hypothetical protein
MKVNGRLDDSVALPVRKIPVSIDQEAGWDSELVWLLKEKQEVSCLCQEMNHDSSVAQALA